MTGKYKVITLCGSTRFKEEFEEAQKMLTLEGNIVLSVGMFGDKKEGEAWPEETLEMLRDLHKRKIDMADEIFVIDVDGYIGESTRSEIEYAKATGKTVRYLEELSSIYPLNKTRSIGILGTIDTSAEQERLRCRNMDEAQGVTPIP